MHAAAAAGQYSPILGPNRKGSALAKSARGVTSIGRLDKAISSDDHDQFDDTISGQHLPVYYSVASFDA